MLVRRIILKIRRFIEIGCLFMLLNYNSMKFFIFEKIEIFRGHFFSGHSVDVLRQRKLHQGSSLS